jgi:hypothetical protein
MKQLRHAGVVILLMLGALTACGGDGNSLDADGDAQGVPGTVSPAEEQTTTP